MTSTTAKSRVCLANRKCLHYGAYHSSISRESTHNGRVELGVDPLFPSQTRDTRRAKLPIDDNNALLARIHAIITSVLRSHRRSHERAPQRHHFPCHSVQPYRTSNLRAYFSRGDWLVQEVRLADLSRKTSGQGNLQHRLLETVHPSYIIW